MRGVALTLNSSMSYCDHSVHLSQNDLYLKKVVCRANRTEVWDSETLVQHNGVPLCFDC